MQYCSLRIPQEKSALPMVGFFAACAALNAGAGAFSGRIFQWFPAKQGAIVGVIQAPVLTAALLSLQRLFDSFRKVEQLADRLEKIQEVESDLRASQMQALKEAIEEELHLDAFEGIEGELLQSQLYRQVAVKALPKTFALGVLGFVTPLITRVWGFDPTFKRLKLYYQVSFVSLLPLRYLLVWGAERIRGKNGENT
ncbi:MAG: hypothetical protein JSR80_07865 [Verrucomicrobia bacterium]|nr:hypothetical protein [Verrucomicrobiota bacterium]